MTALGPTKAALDRALMHHQSGRIEAAVTEYRHVLELDPKQPDALHLLGLCIAPSQPAEAENLLRRALDQRPDDATFQGNLSLILADQNRLEEAAQLAARAVALAPNDPAAHRALGLALARQGQHQSASRSLQTALNLDPNHPDTLTNLAGVLAQLGQKARAEQLYTKALALQPNHPESLNNLAVSLLEDKRAAEAEALLHRALKARPNFTEALNNLGHVQQMQGKTDEARKSYRAALQLQGDRPLWRIREHMVMPLIPGSAKAIDFARKRFLKGLENLPQISIQNHLAALGSSHAEPPYYLAYQGQDNLEAKSRCADLFQAPPVTFPPRGATTRIVFIVTAGHEGIFGQCTLGLMDHWGETGAQLTLAAPPHALEQIRAVTSNQDMVYLSLPQNLPEALKTLREGRFDLAYFWEVGSDSLNYFLALARVAPVQCTSWGTAETSGLSQVDYYLSSRMWENEDAAGYYRERLILLDRVPMVYDPPSPPKSPSPFSSSRRTYLCVQNLFKLHPDFDQLLIAQARRDPQADIMLVSGKQEHWTRLLQQRLHRAAPEEAQRIRFLPRLSYDDYLAAVRGADVLLDSLHFSGGNTSYEAFAMNRPVVTLPGQFIRGRFTYGCYRTMGLTQPVAEDREQYLELCLRIANDPVFRRSQRDQIEASRDSLFKDHQAAIEFETTLVKLAQAGPPAASTGSPCTKEAKGWVEPRDTAG